jgi:hypothetical protein
METLRILVSIPLLIADAIWDVLTRDEVERDIAAQRQRLRDLAEGQ